MCYGRSNNNNLSKHNKTCNWGKDWLNKEHNLQENHSTLLRVTFWFWYNVSDQSFTQFLSHFCRMFLIWIFDKRKNMETFLSVNFEKKISVISPAHNVFGTVWTWLICWIDKKTRLGFKNKSTNKNRNHNFYQ